ncbi:MAG: DUF502 domain-containing protein [Pirellulaceae bacterium]
METQQTNRRPPGLGRLIRNRIVAGLFVALPLFITFLVLDWVYRVLLNTIIGPISRQLLRLFFPAEAADTDGIQELPFWIEFILAPLAAVLVVLALLYIAGMFFRSRLHRLLDWILLTVPGVNVIYSAVKNVIDALGSSQSDTERFKRTVLVEFPHPGTKVPAFVTADCVDEDTGRKLLSVYVPTTPIPTSGYVLLVPEDEVVEIDWDLNETLQAIVSGGITMPPKVRYNRPQDLEDQPKLVDDKENQD